MQALTNRLGRPASIEDLRPATINQYLIEIFEAGRSPYTGKPRTGLLVLLRLRSRLGGLRTST